MIRCFLFILLFILTSCTYDFHNKYENDFDSPLLTQNEKFRLSGDYDSLVKLNKTYYEKAEKIGYNEGKALCFLNLANVNLPLENYKRAEFFFDKANKILKDSKNNIHKAKFNNDYGNFQVYLKRLDKSFEYNTLAMNYIENTKESSFRNDVLFKIYYKRGDYFYRKKQYNQALEYFRKGGKLDQSGRTECAIGDLYLYGFKNMDSARIYLSKIAESCNRQGRTDGVALNANTVLGEYYLITKQYDKAEESLLKALEINNKTKFVFAQYTQYIYTDLKSLYESKGDKEKALKYLQAYTHERSRSDTALLEAINDDMDSFIVETETDTKNHRYTIMIIIVVSALVFALIGIYARKIIKQLRSRKKQLKDETKELENKIYNTSQQDVIELARKNDPTFLDTFKKAYPGFIEKVLGINPDLENSDLVFCALLKLHFTSKEIANYTCVQPRSIQQKKYRLRKKLNIPTETDTYQFFDSLI
ncbi:tetratricopeptide repeat protein [Chryseobacterium carnipullorum]|uniref:tetratricopeptide repeat protein n=1 Tax=Chryseobacterium carnipullorum TaxID=1124835 RepID=UPI0009129EF0|nr:tetratricopeptide repeat protein [Chryseobacterium carnipullorum]SHM54372.1 Tetratricopeptide repeat-containing protein [Chryseobacterium carnipullorum]HBV14745.1 tetratricopeptide repeat protein [Chryseobacterium carnipullorum]